MPKRPISRVADDQLRTRAAVKYYSLGDTTDPRVPVSHFEAVVCYLESHKSGVWMIRLLGLRAKTEGACARVGGIDRIAFCKDAAIGRRSCPDCWGKVDRDSIRVIEHGPKTGTCKHCGREVDHILTAARPYFYYYSTDNDLRKPLISGRSREMYLADELKTALLFTTRAGRLVPPELVEARERGEEPRLLCRKGFEQPIVFDQNEYSLIGTHGRVRYDFWTHWYRYEGQQPPAAQEIPVRRSRASTATKRSLWRRALSRGLRILGG
jgi:hypothetical protein